MNINKEQYLQIKNLNSYTIEMLYEMYLEEADIILVPDLPTFQFLQQQYMLMGGCLILEKVYNFFDKKFDIK